jgi:hypothetical protein
VSEQQTPPTIPNGNTVVYRVAELEKDLTRVERKVDKLLWALVTLTLSIAGSAVIFAITVLTLRGNR